MLLTLISSIQYPSNLLKDLIDALDTKAYGLASLKNAIRIAGDSHATTGEIVGAFALEMVPDRNSQVPAPGSSVAGVAETKAQKKQRKAKVSADAEEQEKALEERGLKAVVRYLESKVKGEELHQDVARVLLHETGVRDKIAEVLKVQARLVGTKVPIFFRTIQDQPNSSLEQRHLMPPADKNAPVDTTAGYVGFKQTAPGSLHRFSPDAPEPPRRQHAPRVPLSSLPPHSNPASAALSPARKLQRIESRGEPMEGVDGGMGALLVGADVNMAEASPDSTVAAVRAALQSEIDRGTVGDVAAHYHRFERPRRVPEPEREKAEALVRVHFLISLCSARAHSIFYALDGNCSTRLHRPPLPWSSRTRLNGSSKSCSKNLWKKSRSNQPFPRSLSTS
jgi:hypothetical protein